MPVKSWHVHLLSFRKKIIMKKLFLVAAIFTFGLMACHNEEKTNESKPYQTTDTTKVENVNSVADSSHQD
jgi:uncharacterized lipoprotein YajG